MYTIMKNHNRLITKLSTVVVSLAMAIGVGVAAGSNNGFLRLLGAEVNNGDGTYSDTISGGEVVQGHITWEIGGGNITIISSSGGGNAVANTNRLYRYNYMEFTASNGYTISSISIVYNGTYRGANNAGGTAITDNRISAGQSSVTVTDTNKSNGTITITPAESVNTHFYFQNAATGDTNTQLRWTTFTINYTKPAQQSSFSVSYSANTEDSSVQGIPSGHNQLENGAEQALTVSPAPTRYGYTFGGWAATSESTTPITSVTIDGSDVVVYAIWTKDLSIHGVHPESPYSIEEAKAAIEAGEHVNEVYTTGVIYSVGDFNSDYNSISYWISETGFGSTSNKDGLQVFGGLNIEGQDDFASADDLSVGDVVVIKGNLQKYYGTYQYNKNNRLVSRAERNFVSFEVAHQPTKTTYFDSQSFDTTGLIVNATFNAAPTSVDITSIIEWPSLTAGMTSIQGSVVYNGNAVKTPEIAITVSADTLDHIVVSGSMSKTAYRDSDGNFSAEGLTVTAHYASGHSAVVTENIEWSFSPEFAIGVTSVVATATYTENEVAKSASSTAQTVTVVEGPGAELLPADFKSGSYSANNQDGVTSSTGGFHFVCFDTYKNGDYIQVRKTKDSDKGYFYNDAAPLGVRISKIVVPVTTNSITVYLGTSALTDAQAEDNENCYTFDSTHSEFVVSGDFTYVRFETGEAYCQLNSVSIWYTSHTPEISVSPSSFSFEQTDEGNIETTITKQYFGEQEVSYEATSSNTDVVADSSIQIENSVVSIAKANINVGTTTISVNAKVGNDVKASTTFTVTCTAHNRIFVSYAIKTEATKKVFDAGDTFDVTGLVVEGTFDAEPTKEDITAQCTYKLVDATGRVSDLVPGTTVLSGGTYSVKIVYGTTETLTYQINVLTIASIAVKTQPTKTSYRIGDAFDPTGLVLEGTKSDGTSKEDITEGFTCSTLDSTTAGQKTITVTYNGLTTTLTVTVVDNVYYSQIKSASDLKAGDKLLVVAPKNADDNYVYMNATISNNVLGVNDVKIADGKITQTDAIEKCEVTLGGQEGAWTLANKEGKLLTVTGDKKVGWADASADKNQTWSIAINSDGTFAITNTASGAGSLQYNYNNGTNPRFTSYSSKQVSPLLFKVGAKDPLAEKKAAAIAAIDAHVATLTQADYSETGWAEITRLVSSAKEKINAETKLDNIDGIVTEFKANVAAVKTAAQEAEAAALKQAQDNACTELARYFQAINQEEYNEAGKLALAAAYDAGIASIKGTNAVADVATALTNAKAALDAVEKQGTTPTEKTLTSIAVTTNPTKTTYNVGEQADYAGLVVTATYSDGSTEAIALASLTISGFSSSEAGTKTITVTYQGKTATFTVTVVDSTPAEDPLAEAKANAINELDTLVSNLNRDDYSDEAWAQIQNALAEAKTAINGATDAEALNTLVANAKTTINAVKDNLELAKAAALSALEQYYNSFDKNNYDETGLASLRSAYNDGRDAIEAATNTDAVAAALANAKAALDAVATKPAAPAAKRCGGDIAATSIILSTIALAGVALLVLRKRKED